MLVDFTEMLSVTRRTMERFSIKGPVRYLITGEIRNVPDDSVDVALNFNSFMEMDRDVRDNYFEEIYRTTRRRGLFMNCNRMQRHMTMRDDRKYENNPLTYHYKATDEIVAWEPDRVQEDRKSRKLRSNNESFAICRVSQVST